MLDSALPLGSAEPGNYFPPPDKDGGWRTLTAATQIRKLAGIDLARLNQAFEFEKNQPNCGLLVLRHG